MNSIYGYSEDMLKQYLISLGEKPFRSSQLIEWIYRHKISSFDEITNIKKDLIKKIKEDFIIDSLECVTYQKSTDGTCKFLFRLSDGNLIETVLMNHDYGYSVCVTTEVGCNMGCAFCASGMKKKLRNLTTSEIVLQVMMVSKIAEVRVSHVVVMGIGEPFDNYETVLKFLQVVNYAKGLEIGARHITVSTCGIVPKIKEFASFPLQINLAISLHAPNDEVRNQIMKINKRYKIEEVIEAVKEYIKVTNRRITFEYILLKGINDTPKLANQLADLVKDINCYVNLIPYNEVSTKPFKKTSSEDAQRFFEILHQRGINATLRMEHGSDISAACGQLRAKKILEENNE